MSQRTCEQVGTLTWFLEWNNSLSVDCDSCSLDDVLVKMGTFYEYSLLIERVGFNPSRK